jgi:SAM-dependent methyltransferase
MPWAAIDADNVEFVKSPNGMPELPAESFDVVMYTLSLHHVPIQEMSGSLLSAARLLRKDGIIVVIEPGDGGSFTEVKERFGAGSGDERPAKESAIRAMDSLEGWSLEEAVIFLTQFQFDDDEDFLANMLPTYRQKPENMVDDVRCFLLLHQTGDGIILDADRRLSVLRRL